MSFIIDTKNTKDLEYVLVDSGNSSKLEIYGDRDNSLPQYIVDRPDPQALWQKKANAEAWEKIDAKFFETKSGKREESPRSTTSNGSRSAECG